MQACNKDFVLTWMYAGKVTSIIQGSAQICQSKKKEIQNEPQYRKGVFVLRTLEGFLKQPYWEPKLKTKKLL